MAKWLRTILYDVLPDSERRRRDAELQRHLDELRRLRGCIREECK